MGGVVRDGAISDLPIRAGEILLLPAGVPHSPQRFANSVGLVIERRRRNGELDGLQWYCERCQHLLYEEFFALAVDIEDSVSARVQALFRQPVLAHLQALRRRHGAAGDGGRRPWLAMIARNGRAWTSMG